MALGNSAPACYLSIKEGKIIYKSSKDAEEQSFNYLDNVILKDIYEKSQTVNGTDMTFLHFRFNEAGSKEQYDLSIYKDGSVARTIILCLGDIKDFSKAVIRISPYTSISKKDSSKSYTNIGIRVNGEKKGWCIDPKEMPEIKPITNSKGIMVAKDDSLRQDFIQGYIDRIKEALKRSATPDDDLPADDRMEPDPEGFDATENIEY